MKPAIQSRSLACSQEGGLCQAESWHSDGRAGGTHPPPTAQGWGGPVEGVLCLEVLLVQWNPGAAAALGGKAGLTLGLSWV